MRWLAVVPMLGCLPISLIGAPQAGSSKAARAAVADQLLTTYTVARFAGPTMQQAGSILLVQKDGIGAVPGSGTAFMAPSFGNNYRDGRVRHDKVSELLQGRLEGLRNLAPGERVYLVKVQVTDTSVIFDVQSCGACDPAVMEPYPVRATVTFPFGKGYLESTRIEQIRQTVGDVFALADASSLAPPAQPVPTTQEAIPPSLPSTAPPPTEASKEPAVIEVGQTVEQVQAILGQPETVVDLGSKKILVYRDLKITFLDGKVSDVQ